MRNPILAAIIAVAAMSYSIPAQQEKSPRIFSFADPGFSRGQGTQPRVLVIAHRGGVVTPRTPECSAGALRKAIEKGYDGVELDLQESRDNVPFVFHDPTLKRASGHDDTIASLASDQLRRIRFLNTDDSIISFAQAAEIARGKLMIMLEIKDTGHSRKYYDEILRVLQQNNLIPFTFFFPNSPETRKALGGKIRLKLNEGDAPALIPTLPDPAQQYFAFGLPVVMKKLPLAELRSRGVPIIPAINTFRYPSDRHMELAAKEIREMLELGVDGFQIDSVYEEITRQAILEFRHRYR